MKEMKLNQDCKSPMSIRETEVAIKAIKDYFEMELAKKLNLTRVSAPLLVKKDSGINDNLNGVERPVCFDAISLLSPVASIVEIVQSLAKWKRIALSKYGFCEGEGLYTDMNAIRRDEVVDNLHSIYVDQWDWEKVISKKDRSLGTLKAIVKDIYEVFINTEIYTSSLYPQLEPILPKEIFFITTQELEDTYPDISPKEREAEIAKKYKAVFIMQIGEDLKSGIKHDGRSPDYDDWSLNGDLVFWYPTLDCAIELSSMGIRVDEEALINQLKISDSLTRRVLPFHQMLLNGELPYTIGGGIGQSRICMFFLRKLHVGEVQASVWPQDMIAECEESGIQLL